MPKRAYPEARRRFHGKKGIRNILPDIESLRSSGAEVDDSDFTAEVLRINERYLCEVVESFDLCPWAKSTRNSAKLQSDSARLPPSSRSRS